MKPSDKVRHDLLMALSGKSVHDITPLSDALRSITQEFSDVNWVNDILMSRDLDTEGLINMRFQQDAQGSLIPLVPAGAQHFLTPDGEYELSHWND